MASKDNQKPEKDIQQDAVAPKANEQAPDASDENAVSKDQAIKPDQKRSAEPDAKAQAALDASQSDSDDHLGGVNASVKKVGGAASVVRRYVMFALLAVVFAYVGHVVWQHYQASKRVTKSGPELKSSLKAAPKAGGDRLPNDGIIHDKNYAELLLKRENMNAKQAMRKGRSNIPSVLSAKVAANDFGQNFSASKKNQAKQAGSKDYSAISPDCDITTLMNAKKAGVSADELRCKGCDAKALHKAGFSAGELYAAGYSVNSARKAGYSTAELEQAGYGLKTIKASHVPLVGKDSIEGLSPSVEALKRAGFSAKDLKTMGIMDDAIYRNCYPVKQLLSAGYTTKMLLDMGYLPVALHKAGVSVNALENAGVSKAALQAGGLLPMHYKKCDVAQIKTGHDQGIKASQWLAKGCSPMSLKKARYSLGELLDAGLGVPEIAQLQFSAKDMAEAGVPVKALRLAGAAADKLQVRYGYNLSDLRKAGYRACDFKAGSVDPTSLHLAGYNADDLVSAGYSFAALRKAGLSVPDLLGAGASLHDLLNAGFKLKALHKAGLSSDVLHRSGISASAAKKAGYNSKDLHLAGYGYGELVRAGFPPQDLQKEGIGYIDKKECASDYIKNKKGQGVSLIYFKNKGCSAGSLHRAGYDWASLKGVGFDASALQVAGAKLRALKKLFTADELAKAGVGGDRHVARAVGRLQCDRLSIAQAVKDGTSARSFMLKGCGPAVLKAGGYSMEDLRNAGFDALALKEAGFSNKDIASAGFTKAELKKVGLSGNHLNAALESQISAGEAKPLSQEALLRKQLDDSYSKMSKQEKEQEIKKLQGVMKAESKKLMNDWKGVNKMSGQGMKLADVVSVMKAGYGLASGHDGKVGKGNQKAVTYHQSDQTHGKGPRDQLIKAGSISYAVIDNTVSSDTDKTPVLATVVEGPLRGAKLLGKFTTNNDLMTITFNKISVPWRDQSAAIDVMAIDPDTAEAALASSVDHHYWKKYGILFASSFLQGMGNAVNNASTTVSSSVGTYSFQTAGLTVGEKLLSALGQVGTNISSEVQTISNGVKTTVTVDAGTSIGLLFTNDYEIPR